MSKVIKLRWLSDAASDLPRRDRRSCDYEAYVPDRLLNRPMTLDGDVAADVADAEIAIARFNETAAALTNTEALARLLLRAEAVASSRLEGLEVGSRRLLRGEAAQALGEDPRDVTANEVLGNIHAMTSALSTLSMRGDITLDTLLEAHRQLLAGTYQEHHAGAVRSEQNWIGGSDYNPCSASFVPPPPEHVRGLMDDLCAFCNTDDLPAVAQAALAHAQFETIHPFADGNGRIGRVLIHLVLRRRGLAIRVLPPVSLVLATWSRDYINGLSATRYLGSPDSQGAHDGINQWVAVFASACRRAVGDAQAVEEDVAALQANWRTRIRRIRSGSAVDLLINALPGAPVVTVKAAAELIGRTFQATNEATSRLVAAGILKQVKVGRRNRAFEAPELIRQFTGFERQLASPAGDTRSSPRARHVPPRPAPV